MRLRNGDVAAPKKPEARAPDSGAVRLVRESLAKIDNAVAKNTAALNGLERKPVAYKFTIRRDKGGLIEEVIATPLSET